uniref:Uncharacterized protein n=1 Tax=Anguilla anguilla TaxID=7936 RepID=A0A0E9XFM9_ANGAN
MVRGGCSARFQCSSCREPTRDAFTAHGIRIQGQNGWFRCTDVLFVAFVWGKNQPASS